jgi:hypothetical protein
MKIVEVKTRIEHEVEIERLGKQEFKVIATAKQFGFNWRKYSKLEVYKLSLVEDKTILGLMCLIDHPEPGFESIEIEALESSNGNTGKNKNFDRIAGCLIAHACRESLGRGYQGLVFLKPKTYLIKRYQEYGFVHFPFRTVERPEGIMVLEGYASNDLIKRYSD